MKSPAGKKSWHQAVALLASAALLLGMVPVSGHTGCGASSADGQAAHHGDQTASTSHAEHEAQQRETASVSKGLEPCSHCPAEQCAVTAPCSGSTSFDVSATLAGLSAPGLAGSASAPWRPAHSFTGSPPTPPPTSVL